MRRTVCFLALIIAGCVHLAPAPGINGRINIRFCKNASKAEKDAFFFRLNLKPIAYNIFGYDIAEWTGAPPKITQPLFNDVLFCTSKNATDEMLVREYEIETKRLMRPSSRKRLAPKKIINKPAASKISTPWFEELIKSEESHRFLKAKNTPLWENGIVFADEGLSFAHPDIKPALKYNKDKKPIFWMNSKSKISDFVGTHGTFVSCLAAGYRDNKGIEGVAAGNAYILPLFLKFGHDDGSFSSDIAIGLAYYMELEKKGEIFFHVVNMSFTMNYDSKIVHAAIKHMGNKLFVVAGGNSGDDNIPKNIDEKKYYPASWNLPNIITVVATDKDDKFAINTSNYGPIRADVAAPGEEITSCTGDNGYKIQKGTSFSTAMVSGTLSLLYSIDPYMDEESAKYALLLGATPKHDLMDRVRKGKRLNVYASVRLVHVLMYGIYEK